MEILFYIFYILVYTKITKYDIFAYLKNIHAQIYGVIFMYNTKYWNLIFFACL
jgi:hypothetical protein